MLLHGYTECLDIFGALVGFVITLASNDAESTKINLPDVGPITSFDVSEIECKGYTFANPRIY